MQSRRPSCHGAESMEDLLEPRENSPCKTLTLLGFPLRRGGNLPTWPLSSHHVVSYMMTSAVVSSTVLLL